MRKHALVVASSAVLLLTLAACGSSGSSTGSSSTDPIIVGAVAPLTGVEAVAGQEQLVGLKAAVLYVNDHGGILGRKVQLETEDSGGNPAQAVADFKLLVGKHVSVVFGDLLAGYAAMVPLFGPAGVISMSQNTTESIWANPSTNPNGFNTFITTTGYAQLYVDYLVNNYHIKKLGIIGSTDDFATSMFSSVQAYAKTKGIPVVVQQFDPNATSVVTQLRALKNAGVDGLISATFDAGQVLSIQGQQALGWDVPTVTSNTLNDSAGVAAVKAAGLKNIVGGPVSKVILIPSAGAPESANANILLDYLQKVTGETNFDGSQSNALTWFDGLLVYKAAAQKSHSIDANVIRSTLEDGQAYAGLSGDYVYSKASHITKNVDNIFGLYLGGLTCQRVCVAAPGTF